MQCCCVQGKHVRLTPQQWAEFERRVQQGPRHSMRHLSAEFGICRDTYYRRKRRKRCSRSLDVRSTVGGRRSDAEAGCQHDTSADNSDAGCGSVAARAVSPQLPPAVGLSDDDRESPATSREWGEVCPQTKPSNSDPCSAPVEGLEGNSKKTLGDQWALLLSL